MKDFLLEKVKQVKILNSRFPIYEGVEITTEIVDPANLKPIAKYVLRENLARVSQMRENIYNVGGFDVFKMPALVQYRDFVVSPPIIENDLIVDGLHRCWESLHNGRALEVIRIRGVDENLPPIGMPIDWSYIEIRDTKPTNGWECRELRPNLLDESGCLRKLFRDFSGLGSTGRRPCGKQTT